MVNIFPTMGCGRPLLPRVFDVVVHGELNSHGHGVRNNGTTAEVHSPPWYNSSDSPGSRVSRLGRPGIDRVDRGKTEKSTGGDVTWRPWMRRPRRGSTKPFSFYGVKLKAAIADGAQVKTSTATAQSDESTPPETAPPLRPIEEAGTHTADGNHA